MSRDIDAKVAEKIMGWTPDEMGCWSTEKHPSHGGRVRWCKPDSEGLDCLNDAEIWSPSTDPAAAMQVVERIHEMFPGACVSFGLCSTTDMKKANSDPQPDNCDGPMCGVGSIEWYTGDPVECHLYAWTVPYGTGSKTAAACLALCKAALRAVAGDEGGGE